MVLQGTQNFAVWSVFATDHRHLQGKSQAGTVGGTG
jgi:hypothetical protein